MKRVAIISGGSTGIGFAIAKSFAQSGISVTLLARGQEQLEQATNEINNYGGICSFQVCDLTKAADIKNSIKQIADKEGQIDILVNSAGGGPVGGLMDISEEIWKNSISLKLLGYINLTKEVVPYLINSKNGRIINIVGVFGKQPHPNFVIGSTINAALLSFTKAIANEMAPYKINVNAINPGASETPLWTETLREMSISSGESPKSINDAIVNSCPLGRLSYPTDVADVAQFLISPQSNFITGCSINVDGGAYSGY